MSSPVGEASARACANIALAKYWGKSDAKHNIPAVPSISLTLDRLTTETRVVFDASLEHDEVRLDGRPASDSEVNRVTEMLDRVRKEAELRSRARVTSRNSFPTAAGLASSASGFAALAAASASAAGLKLSPRKLSALARRSSASAARSVFGGFVELPAGEPGDNALSARAVASADHWPVRLIVAVTDEGPKAVGSTEGMERSRKTSPYYDAWLDAAPKWARKIKAAIKKRDLDQLGPAMEQSTFAFHSCAITASPSILYWSPATLAALDTVRRLREGGASAWATMDAGPHVKVLCSRGDAATVQKALNDTSGVRRTIATKPGPAVEVIA